MHLERLENFPTAWGHWVWHRCRPRADHAAWAACADRSDCAVRLVGSAMLRPYRQREHRLPRRLAFRTERCAPRDQASVTDTGSAASAAAVTEAAAMTEATVPEARMGE